MQIRPEIYPEISQLNREFFRLLLHPSVPLEGSVLGLKPEWLGRMAALSEAQLHTASEVPCLLMELAGKRDGYACGAAATDARPEWQHARQMFVMSLLTYMRQLHRQDKAAARRAGVVIAGPATGAASVEDLSFRDIRRLAFDGAVDLRARFTDHPRFWPDLLDSAADGSSRYATVSRLSVLPLMVAEVAAG